MYDEDEDEYEIEAESSDVTDESAEAFEQKGVADRAFVDQQAKEYDEQKKRKRDEIARLKNERLALNAKLTHKQHDLSALEIAIRKDEYVETREHVRSVRDEAVLGDAADRSDKAESEIAVINETLDREERETQRDMLVKEKDQLKAGVDELSRKISLLEHEILRS